MVKTFAEGVAYHTLSLGNPAHVILNPCAEVTPSSYRIPGISHILQRVWYQGF